MTSLAKLMTLKSLNLVFIPKLWGAEGWAAMASAEVRAYNGGIGTEPQEGVQALSWSL